MQQVELSRDVISKIDLLQLSVNNLIAANTQYLANLGVAAINSTDMGALTSAMTTLQADRVTLKNASQSIVAGN